MGTRHWGKSEGGTTTEVAGTGLLKLHWAHKPPGIFGRQMVVWLDWYEAYDAAFSRMLLVSLDPPQPEAHNPSEKVRNFGLRLPRERPVVTVSEAVQS